MILKLKMMIFNEYIKSRFFKFLKYMKTLEELKAKRSELEKKTEKLQTEHASHEFSINLEDRKMIKTIMEHLDKGYTWKTQNAAVVVTLYDKLKSQYNESVKSDDNSAISIKLRGHELNGLYQALLNVEAIGVERARKFIKMLTVVGETVTDAMALLADMNQEIHKIHQELQDLDKKIDEASKVVDEIDMGDLEIVENETQK